MFDALLEILTTYQGLPLNLASQNFADAKEKCAAAFRLHKKEILAYEAKNDDLMREIKVLKRNNDEIDYQFQELQEKFNHLTNKHEILLCDYNTLKNKYVKTANIPQSPVIRRAIVIKTDEPSSPSKKKRKTETEKLYE